MGKKKKKKKNGVKKILNTQRKQNKGLQINTELYHFVGMLTM